MDYPNFDDIPVDTNEVEFLEIELDFHREKFDKLFTTNGEVVDGTTYWELFTRSMTIIDYEDKIWELRRA